LAQAQLAAMAPIAGKAAVTRAEAIWREAWVGSQYTGEVALEEDREQERLIVRCRDVLLEHKKHAEILDDDGRTVGVAIGDGVVFGVVPRPGKSPIAVNVYRTEKPPGNKKRKAELFGKTEDEILPDNLVGEQIGIIRHQSPNTGDYFIECEQVDEVYGRDAKIRSFEMPEEFGIGDVISFLVVPPSNDYNAPLASKVKRASKEDAEAAVAKGIRRRGAGGCILEGRVPVPKRRHKAASDIPTMRMVGIVKRQSANSGRHSILCQDISDVYGKDAQIAPEEVLAGGLKVGDKIAFDVDEPSSTATSVQTPMARNVKLVGSSGGKKKSVVQDDAGDGEDIAEAADAEDMGADAGADAEAWDDEPNEEATVAPEDMAEVDAADQLERELAKRGGGEESQLTEAWCRKTWADGEKAKTETQKPKAVAPVKEPKTPEEWAAQQCRLFPNHPKLKKGWIRIRSKTKGLVYYYNTRNGESTPVEPLA